MAGRGHIGGCPEDGAVGKGYCAVELADVKKRIAICEKKLNAKHRAQLRSLWRIYRPCALSGWRFSSCEALRAREGKRVTDSVQAKLRSLGSQQELEDFQDRYISLAPLWMRRKISGTPTGRKGRHPPAGTPTILFSGSVARRRQKYR